ncbi:hypothetical protein [Butyrivibrio fibrisolvens]|uniref:hypothetical protein n=1 Tax=Butyrivibrio fibrisolvens TaxID=831 RepID=UPI0003B66D1B|nr:hypothetical protein [Butyrivibrio fibrisolvens]
MEKNKCSRYIKYVGQSWIAVPLTIDGKDEFIPAIESEGTDGKEYYIPYEAFTDILAEYKFKYNHSVEVLEGIVYGKPFLQVDRGVRSSITYTSGATIIIDGKEIPSVASHTVDGNNISDFDKDNPEYKAQTRAIARAVFKFFNIGGKVVYKNKFDINGMVIIKPEDEETVHIDSADEMLIKAEKIMQDFNKATEESLEQSVNPIAAHEAIIGGASAIGHVANELKKEALSDEDRLKELGEKMVEVRMAKNGAHKKYFLRELKYNWFEPLIKSNVPETMRSRQDLIEYKKLKDKLTASA